MAEVRNNSAFLTALWVVFGVLVGLGASSWLELGGRERLFPIALAVGAVVIALVWGRRRSLGADVAAVEVNDGTASNGAQAGPVLASGRGSVAVLTDSEATLDGEQAREWLDDFMARQQS